MASKLRWVTITGASAPGQTQEDNIANFENESDNPMSIIVVKRRHYSATTSNDEQAQVELSKSPTGSSVANQDPTFREIDHLVGRPSGAGVLEGKDKVEADSRYDDGEVILEPSERLYVNVVKSTGVTANVRFVVGYRFIKD